MYENSADTPASGSCRTIAGILLIVTGGTMLLALVGEDVYHLVRYGENYRYTFNIQSFSRWFKPFWFTAFGIFLLPNNKRGLSALSLLFGFYYLIDYSNLYPVTHYPNYCLETMACLMFCLHECTDTSSSGRDIAMVIAQTGSVILAVVDILQQKYLISTVSTAVFSIYKLPLLLCFCFVALCSDQTQERTKRSYSCLSAERNQ